MFSVPIYLLVNIHQYNTIQYNLGPDRLESIIYDITEKKIDNPHSRLLLCFSL